MQEYNDVLFVCAAGNNGGVVPVYPAAFELSNSISVGSFDWTGHVSKFSNLSESVDVGTWPIYIATLLDVRFFSFRDHFPYSSLHK